MTKIIDGKKIRSQILESVKVGVAQLSFTPVFCDVLVGDDPVSLQYVNMKAKIAESVGISFSRAHFASTISTKDLVKEIAHLNKVPNICGLIVQLPLPAHLDVQIVLNAIDQRIDVDCLGKEASTLFYEGKSGSSFPAALACMAVLDSLQLDLTKKNIIVIGQGMLVGKPVTHLLGMRGLKAATIQSETEHKEERIKYADIIISATGQGKFITGDMIKEAAIIIDAGTSESMGGIVGDVDLESVKNVASYVSPTPGGVGPVTVAMLLSNVLKVAQKH